MTDPNLNGRYPEDDVDPTGRDPVIRWLSRIVLITSGLVFLGLMAIAFALIWRAVCWILGVG